MSDVIEISNDAMELEDDGAQDVFKLKEQASKRKGRGFTGERANKDDSLMYERIDSDDVDEKRGPQRSVEGWILFVTSIHEEAQEDDIFEKFSEFGEIKNVHLNLDRRTGFLKGYALVEYGLYKDALAAKEALNGTELLGQTIGVDWCFVKRPSKEMSRRH